MAAGIDLVASRTNFITGSCLVAGHFGSLVYLEYLDQLVGLSLEEIWIEFSR
jgi:hypothetical protein